MDIWADNLVSCVQLHVTFDHKVKSSSLIVQASLCPNKNTPACISSMCVLAEYNNIPVYCYRKGM